MSPLYEYECAKCGKKLEKFQPITASTVFPCFDCNSTMTRGIGNIAVLKMDGMFPSRKVWMDNWTPESPSFSTGSLHGEHY